MPAEILSRIFLLVSSTSNTWDKDPCDAPWGPGFRGGQPRKLIPLTSVCQRWRSILLNTPLLWSTIEEKGYKGVPDFTHYVHRCPRGSLSVRIHSRLHDTTRELLARHGERVQDLHIIDSVFGDGGGELLFGLVPSFRAEDLRRCRLLLHNRQYTGPPFQTFFHDGRAPQLRQMWLESFPYLPRNKFPTLTHLIIECPKRASFSFQDLQTFLSGCPDLQVLHLKNMTGSGLQAPRMEPAAPSSIHLRHLRKLSIVDKLQPRRSPTWDQTARFVAGRGALQLALLSSLALPSQCLVYLSHISSTDLKSLADRMSTLVQPSSMRIVDALQDDCSPRKSGRISLVLLQPSASRGVRFDVQYRRCNEDEDAVKKNMCRAIAASPLFADVRELWADAGSADFLRWPNSIFGSLPRLTYLSIRHEIDTPYQLNYVLEALREVLAGGELVCPELDTLVLTINAVYLIGQVRDLVLCRKNLGRPLTRLWLWLDLGKANEAARAEARALTGLVEHFILFDCLENAGEEYYEGEDGDGDGDGEDAPESGWVRSWDERVPEDCGVEDEIKDHWPIWVERGLD